MRTRNIKLNVFLNEEEQKLLKQKSTILNLTQSDFIRKLIKDYKYNLKPEVDINNTIKTIIKDLTRINNYMHKWRYTEFENLLNNDINDLNELITDKDNAR